VEVFHYLTSQLFQLNLVAVCEDLEVHTYAFSEQEKFADQNGIQ